MRYLIDSEYRKTASKATKRLDAPYASAIRYELSQRNIRWALEHAYAHEISMGKVPAVLYKQDDQGRHGNFIQSSYRCIQEKPKWARRLKKVHTSARRCLLSHDPERGELDSSNSSDALLMNVFCHPETLATPAVLRVLGVSAEDDPLFGYRAGVPLTNGRRDCTEIDMKLGELLIEAKLTEFDFQTASLRLIERYLHLEEVFDPRCLEVTDGKVQSYQLIRGVLAAYAHPGHRFCVLCDARRPDLIERWHQVLSAVRLYDLRSRLQLLTWQELSGLLPDPLQAFLGEKFGIRPL